MDGMLAMQWLTIYLATGLLAKRIMASSEGVQSFFSL